jgi:hypothetical protein
MFDFRYHVVSLGAVFLALAVGILVGIGIADRGLIESTSEKLVRAQVADLEENLDASDARIARLEQRQQSAEAFISEAYPRVIEERLDGTRVALVFVGSVSGAIRSAVEDTLQDGGGPPVLRMRALRVPIDAEALARSLEDRAGFARFQEDLEELGRALGREFVRADETPLWDALSNLIVEEREGGFVAAAEGVIVARSAEPQRGATAVFLRGFYAGLASAGVPAVGVETSGDDGGAVETFRRATLSTVDNLDTEPGKLALAVLLAGGREGNYGVKDTADDGPLPPLDSAPEPRPTG